MGKVEKFKREEELDFGLTLFEPVHLKVMGIDQKLDSKELVRLFLSNSKNACSGLGNIKEGIDFLDKLSSANYGQTLWVNKRIAKWISEGFDNVTWFGGVCLIEEFKIVIKLIDDLREYLNENKKE